MSLSVASNWLWNFAIAYASECSLCDTVLAFLMAFVSTFPCERSAGLCRPPGQSLLYLGFNLRLLRYFHLFLCS